MNTVVFTGTGLVAPTGIGADVFWSRTLAGDRAIGPVTNFDAAGYPHRLAGEVPGFDGKDHLPSRLLPQTDRMTQMALVAADEALSDSGLDLASMNPFDIGVVTAATAGGFEFGQNELRKLWRDGGCHVSAYQSFAWFYAVNSGQIAIRNGCKGPSGVVVSDQAGGLDALGQARRLIRNGTLAVVSGGVDANICPWGWVAQMATSEMSPSSDPDRAFAPFSEEATGWVPAEGGAMVVLEDSEHAAARGAHVQGTLCGYAATFDPAAHTGRGPNLAAAMQLALDDAGLTPSDIDFVVADAYGLADRDAEEASAITGVFDRSIPVVASKAGTGRMFSGGSVVDVVVALRSLADQVLPPAPGVRPTERYGLDIVTGSPREVTATHAMVLARGIGGFNSCALIAR